jgi:hypothetical protein
VNGTENHVKRNKPDSERQASHDFSHIWNQKLNKMTNDMKVEVKMKGI